jgi:cytochrome bd ubiquinol oxidase subunit I
MDDLLAARIQMGVSLGFHMVFAALGIGLPTLLACAEGLWLRTGRPEYLALARRWSKATAVLFAIGAVSGTALSFELGLLWPRFMAFAGGIIGPAFALEGYAFFLEAIFIGLYLYGWDRLSPAMHWFCGVMVALSGMASGILVVSANAWMQHPVGFRLLGGQPTEVDPVRALFNPAWAVMAVHSTIATLIATAFGVAAVYAGGYLRGGSGDYQRRALQLTLVLGAVAAVAQPLSGDFNARYLSRAQPTKLAAMEAQFQTERGAPLRIGGWPDVERREVRYVIEIPYGLSLLTYHDPHATIAGLEAFPRDQWPNVPLTHVAFQLMVGSGLFLVAVSLLYWLWAWRRSGTPPRWLLWGITAAGPLAFVALESGWIVTEAGRQPWVIRGIMRTSEAVTTAPGVVFTMVAFVTLYLLLATALVWLLLRLARQPQAAAVDAAPLEVPHGA